MRRLAAADMALAASLGGALAWGLASKGDSVGAWSDSGVQDCERHYHDNEGDALTVYFNMSVSDPTVFNAYQTSVQDWIASDSPASFTAVASNWDSYFMQESVQAQYFGRYDYKDEATHCDGGLNGFNVWVNTWWTYQRWDNDPNFFRSVTGHELGHTLGLGHSNQYAIMNQVRDRHVQVNPKPDDVCGINFKYPSGVWPEETDCGPHAHPH